MTHATDPAMLDAGKAVRKAVNAAFAASSLARNYHNFLDFSDGWDSSLNAYVGGPSRGDAWATGRRAGLVYHGAAKPLDTR